MTKMNVLARTVLGIGAVILVAGCSDKERILTGERIDVRVPLSKSVGMESDPDSEEVVNLDFSREFNLALPLSVPPMRHYNSWEHINASRSHQVSNPALSDRISRLWSVSIGKGSELRQRLTAGPILANGLIYTIDAQARVSAHTTEGRQVWATSLIPVGESPMDASSGGLAHDNGILFVTTGFGELHALHATSGRSFWVQEFDAPAILAPMVSNGLVYVVTQDSRGWAIDIGNGRLRWRWQSAIGTAAIASGASPAAYGDMAFIPYPSGEIQAIDARSGLLAWSAAVGGSRGPTARSSVTAITGGPVVADGTVYVANQAGKMSAIDVTTGRVKWTVSEGSYNPVWPVGGSVFLVSDVAELVRLNANSGSRIWAVKLPEFKQARLSSRKAVYANFGPVMAGGRLIVASSDGKMRHFDPVSGALIGETDIGESAASSPIVVNGTLYLTTQNGNLLAFR